MGSTRTLDYLAFQRDEGPSEPHPLQGAVAELVEELLTEKEKFVFFARFGERASHREIARRMGYKSHRVVQILEARLMEKIRKALDEYSL